MSEALHLDAVDGFTEQLKWILVDNSEDKQEDDVGGSTGHGGGGRGDRRTLNFRSTFATWRVRDMGVVTMRPLSTCRLARWR